MTDQLSLFAAPDTPEVSPWAEQLSRVHAEATRLRSLLPDDLHFGTSSWSFPGWRGLVYSSSSTQTALARHGLREYTTHPLLTTVGVDRSFYAPVPVDDLRHYAAQLPRGFRCCFKAPAAVTSASLSTQAGSFVKNPDFLSVDRLVEDLLKPCAAVFAEHTGPIILEFSPFARNVSMEPAEFVASLERFITRLPREFEYAVELRDARLLTPRYRDLLASHRIAHTYNYWSAMPAPGEQAAVVPPEDADFSIVRLLLRPGTWYEDQKGRFTPFNRLVEPDDRMRGEVSDIVRRVLKRKRRVFVLVNNKAEGSSPLTVMALARLLAERHPSESGSVRGEG